MRLSSSLSLSISAPLRPMTIPGRAVRIVMRQRLAARSIRISGTEADSSFFLSSSRMLRSSVSSLPNSFLPAYHLERQSRLTAMRKPIGFVFWPMGQERNGLVDWWIGGLMDDAEVRKAFEAIIQQSINPLIQFACLFIGQDDFDVAVAFENGAGGAASFGCEAP